MVDRQCPLCGERVEKTAHECKQGDYPGIVPRGMLTADSITYTDQLEEISGQLAEIVDLLSLMNKRLRDIWEKV